jgi:hypothetical protein
VKVNHTENLMTRLIAAERRIAALERARPMAGASISEGNLDVRTPDGSSIMRAGVIPYGSETAFGVEVRRQSGGLQARFFDTVDGNGYAAIFDEQGSTIFSEDTFSGFGIATPYLQVAAMPYSSVLSPPQSTTSATFTPLHRLHFQLQQPWLRTHLICQTDASTTGEVQLANAGIPLTTSPLTLDASLNAYKTVDARIVDGQRSFQYVDVEVRRTGGAGGVRVAVAFASGRQS